MLREAEDERLSKSLFEAETLAEILVLSELKSLTEVLSLADFALVLAAEALSEFFEALVDNESMTLVEVLPLSVILSEALVESLVESPFWFESAVTLNEALFDPAADVFAEVEALLYVLSLSLMLLDSESLVDALALVLLDEASLLEAFEVLADVLILLPAEVLELSLVAADLLALSESVPEPLSEIALLALAIDDDSLIDSADALLLASFERVEVEALLETLSEVV